MAEILFFGSCGTPGPNGKIKSVDENRERIVSTIVDNVSGRNNHNHHDNYNDYNNHFFFPRLVFTTVSVQL